MRRLHLQDLPTVELPAGYSLRSFETDDTAALAHLLGKAFEDHWKWDVQKVESDLVAPDDVMRTLIITQGAELVATASVRLLPEQYPGSGYVHWVAASSEHKGRRLGYIVTLAVLHDFVALGCRDAVLETDDHRLPAIQTYLNLGFVPENRHETHAARWAEILPRLK